MDGNTGSLALCLRGTRMTTRAEALPTATLHKVDLVADSARLAHANINPKTGLATDYLNHFNEAIMVLELMSDMPECVDEFMAWGPITYKEHFATSRFKERDLAIAAYDAADPTARQSLDAVADTMNAILGATHEAMQLNLAPDSAGALARQATTWLRPLVARAGAIINGHFVYETCDTSEEAPQLTVDRLLEKLSHG
jgi:hypothetical protein